MAHPVGYRVLEWEVEDAKGTIIDPDSGKWGDDDLTFVGKNWELLEVSICAVSADAHSGFAIILISSTAPIWRRCTRNLPTSVPVCFRGSAWSTGKVSYGATNHGEGSLERMRIVSSTAKRTALAPPSASGPRVVE
jgi:hypothetical protein